MSQVRSVLVVEDSETQALKLAALLERANFNVHRTASAELAIDYLRRNRPDLAIVDYHLPGMSGAELCRLIRQNSEPHAMAVLMLTDDAERDVERRGFESGADDHVTKSADDDVFLARVEALLRQPRSRSIVPTTQTALFASQSILIVDDSPTYLVFLEQELQQEGFRIMTAQSAEEALSIVSGGEDSVDAPSVADGQGIDCIVLDLVMPGMDGIELCARLNELRRTAHFSFPILMVTSHDSKEEMMRALEAGADDFVTKAKDTVILRARIRALLRRKMLHEEHDRILAEFAKKELEVVQARAESKAAAARAALVEELEKANADLKATQVQLVQSAKMASLGALVAGVAHEINNPLAYSLGHLRTISSLLESINAQLDDGAPQSARASLDKARQRARDAIDGLERVADLIVKLRTFSHLDQGEFKLANIRECAEAALTLIRHRFNDTISLVTRFAADNQIFCAPGMINQVIMNLLSNAIDALIGRGEIVLTTSRTREWFAISVADNGPGIQPDVIDRLFDPFFTTKDVGAGTGLGLWISHRIIERHFGRIEARNRKEGGAEFLVHIPTNLAERTDVSIPRS
ncbi:MAG: response regulator [Parvularculaceae bacterium]